MAQMAPGLDTGAQLGDLELSLNLPEPPALI
jgi:hypothetical protein